MWIKWLHDRNYVVGFEPRMNVGDLLKFDSFEMRGKWGRFFENLKAFQIRRNFAILRSFRNENWDLKTLDNRNFDPIFRNLNLQIIAKKLLLFTFSLSWDFNWWKFLQTAVEILRKKALKTSFWREKKLETGKIEILIA